MTSSGLGEMSMGCQAEDLACADSEARTPIGASGICLDIFLHKNVLYFQTLFKSSASTKSARFSSASVISENDFI